jgi:hypothetical protein
MEVFPPLLKIIEWVPFGFTTTDCALVKCDETKTAASNIKLILIINIVFALIEPKSNQNCLIAGRFCFRGFMAFSYHPGLSIKAKPVISKLDFPDSFLVFFLKLLVHSILL